jgi:hypothetical protein
VLLSLSLQWAQGKLVCSALLVEGVLVVVALLPASLALLD